MKKTLIILVLCTLAVGAAAQTKKVVKTRTVNTQYIAQPAIMYAGISYGVYSYSGTGKPSGMDEKYDYSCEAEISGIQFGYLYSPFGDMNKTNAPYVGGEILLGVNNAGSADLAFQLGAVAGIMLGSPKFRLDLSIRPTLSYWGSASYYYDNVVYLYSYRSIEEEKGTLRPNICLRAGFWISHLNIYVQYHNTYGVGLNWRF